MLTSILNFQKCQTPEIGLAEDIRAEKLTIEDFAKITNIILEKTI